MVSAQARRDQVQYARGRGLSRRFACALMGVSSSSLDYQCRRAASDAELRAELAALAAKHIRRGYRFAYAHLRRSGKVVNHKRVERLWRLAGHSVPRRRPRRKIRSGAVVQPVACGINSVWAYDFVFDRCANGQVLKCLTIIDEFTRECLAIDVAASIRSDRVIEVLSRLISVRGAPRRLRSDNGPEFVASAVKDWLAQQHVDTVYIEPGKPWQNAYAESFNSRFRDECLNVEWFFNRREASVLIEAWRRQYNEERPHGSLNNRTPAEFAQLRLRPVINPDREAQFLTS